MPKNNKTKIKMESRNNRINKNKLFIGCRGVSTVDIIIIIVAVIVIVVSGIFLYRNFMTLKQVNEDIAEMKVIIEEKQDTLNKLIELGQSEEILKENYDRNKLYLPESKNEIGIISDISTIIENEKATFRSIAYKTEVVLENGIIDVPFTVRISGTYDQLNNMIEAFGRTDRLYVIDSVVIINSGDGTIINADIEMHAYYKSQ